MCATLVYVNAPQRCVYVMPFGSNIDVARCGWDAHTMSNSEEMFRFAQHDKIEIPCVIASVRKNVWQSTGKESQYIERSKTFDCFGQRPRNDTMKRHCKREQINLTSLNARYMQPHSHAI